MESIIVFGTGKRCKYLIERGAFNNYNILAFCDSSKYGMIINGATVIAPDKMKEYMYDAIFVTTLKYFDEIKCQLINKYGVAEEKIRRLEFAGEKYDSEMNYWMDVFKIEGETFRNAHYKELMLSISGETDDVFWEGKVVADFGCGPRGSLAWTDKPFMKIGIDVLANKYLEKFGSELLGHNMLYVTCNEKCIPIPCCSVDYLCMINSLDHVDNLDVMISELMRILKPNGVILASINLNEAPTECEPQTLTEEIIKEKLLKYIDVQSYQMAYKENSTPYINLKRGNLIEKITEDKPVVLWIKGKKKA